MEILTAWKAEIIAFLGSIVTFIVWLLRLEALVKTNTSDVRGLHRLRNEDIAAAARLRAEDIQASRDARKETNDRLGRIEDDIRAMNTGIQTLLARKE